MTMKLSDNAQAALQQPDTQAVAIEMTPEIKAKFSRLAGQIEHILLTGTDGPLEAYMLLQFIRESFEETFGIRGGIIVSHGDEQQ